MQGRPAHCILRIFLESEGNQYIRDILQVLLIAYYILVKSVCTACLVGGYLNSRRNRDAKELDFSKED